MRSPLFYMGKFVLCNKNSAGMHRCTRGTLAGETAEEYQDSAGLKTKM